MGIVICVYTCFSVKSLLTKILSARFPALCLIEVFTNFVYVITTIKCKFRYRGNRIVTIETGKLARQADGAVTVRQGNCVLLATVVANKEPKEGQDFFPLSVDYQEKFASAGRIPGSFFKREARLMIMRS